MGGVSHAGEWVGVRKRCVAKDEIDPTPLWVLPHWLLKKLKPNYSRAVVSILLLWNEDYQRMVHLWHNLRKTP